MKWFLLIVLSFVVSVEASAIRKDLGKQEMSEINKTIGAIPEIKDIDKKLGDTSYILMLSLEINLHNEPLKDCVYVKIERRSHRDWNPHKYAAIYWDAYFVKYDRINKKVVMMIKE